MSKNNNNTWNTKYGTRRVREEMPTLAEAITAAQGLTDDLDEQADFAAALMGLPRDQVRAELAKLGIDLDEARRLGFGAAHHRCRAQDFPPHHSGGKPTNPFGHRLTLNSRAYSPPAAGGASGGDAYENT